MIKSAILFFLFFVALLKVNAQNDGFIENKGQFPSQVIAAVSLSNGYLFVEKDGLVFSLFDHNKTEEEHYSKKVQGGLPRFAFKQYFEKINPSAVVQFENPLPHYFNYFTPKPITKVSIYQKIIIKDFYPGIDWELLIENKKVKHNFYLENPKLTSKIRWKYLGLNKVNLDDMGINSDLGFYFFREDAPVSFQNRRVIRSRFFEKDGTFGFSIQKLLGNSPVVIDPVLQFSTFTGGLSDNWGFTATYDRRGNAYAGGIVRGPYYPVSFGAIDTSYNGFGSNHDIIITKFDSTGSQILYSTFLGGIQDDEPMSLITDSLGQLYILGHSLSGDFPVVSSSFDTSHNGNWDIVVSKFNDSGTVLLGSTFLGGFEDDAYNSTNNSIWNFSNNLNYNYGDYCRGEINLDRNGNVYVVANTKSTNFPVTSPTIQDTLRGLQDATISSFTSNLSQLRFSTYWGGNDYDAAYAIHISAQDRIYIGGGTKSNNLSPFPSGFQLNFNDTVDGFVLEIDSLGTQIKNGTFVGTASYDQVFLIQTDVLGNVYVAGQTEGNFPITNRKYGNVGGKVFIQKFNSGLSQRNLSTLVGSGRHRGADFSPTAFLVDVCGRIYLAGWGGNLNNLLGTNPFQGNTLGLPTTSNAIKDSTNGNDYYLIVLERDADSLLYGTFLGGNISGEHVDGGTSRFDPQGIVYHAACAGCGGFSDFPTTPNAYSRTNNSTNCNMAIFKLDFQFVRIQANFNIQSSQNLSACQGVQVQFQCLSGSPDSIYWDFDDGTTSTQINPKHTFSAPRTYKVKLFVKNCFNTDTIVKQVTIFPPPQIRISGPPKMCQGQSVQLIASGGVSYTWKTDSTISDTSINNPIVRPPATRKYFVTGVDSNGCQSKDSFQIIVFSSLNPIIEIDSGICAGDSIRLWANQDTDLISSWIWESKKTGLIDSNNYPMFSPFSTDTVYFRYFTKDGCSLVDSIIIKIFYSVIANAGPDVTGCENSTITLTASGGTGFLWNNGQNTASISVSVKDSIQWYSVVVNQGKCKSKPDSVSVFKSTIDALFDVSVDSGYAPQEVKFFNRSSANAQSFLWNFGDGSILQFVVNPIHIYQKEGIYSPKLYVESTNPVCKDTFEYNFIFIDSVKMVIPNAFTPNNDGLNEQLLFEGFNIASIEVFIFDRWGQEIFKGKGEKVMWDGKLRGQNCQAGVYPYLVKAIGKNGKTYRWEGLVTLIR